MPNDPQDGRPSLADVFAPPDDHRRGTFGLVCGLSADHEFIEAALERFTRRGQAGRRHSGQIAMALMTDPHHDLLPSTPGLFHVHPAAEERWPLRMELMHAKVALLSFGPARKGAADHVRLVVSTGNWTTETARRSIDIVWQCDLSAAAGRDDTEAAQAATDIQAAVAFFRKLLGVEKKRGWYVAPTPVATPVNTLFKDCARITKGWVEGELRPRFFSTIDANEAEGSFGAPHSIGRQVIHRFGEDKTKRNFLVCASGFFEGAKQGHVGCPSVLKELVEQLQISGVFKKYPTADDQWLVANPKRAGAVAGWVRGNAPETLGWSIRQPRHPDRGLEGAHLHAKYVFLSYWRNKSLSNNLIYIGSGNLSRQGFALAPRKTGGTGKAGNIETGIVTTAESITNLDELSAMLGLDVEAEVERDSFPAEAKGEEDEVPVAPLRRPPPILAFTWDGKRTLQVHWLDEPASQTACMATWAGQTIEVLAGSNSLEIPEGVPPPASIRIGDENDHWTVSVFGVDGDFCRPPVHRRRFDDVLGRLLDFPSQVWDDDEADGSPDEDEDEDPGKNGGDGTTTPSPGTVPDPLAELAAERRSYPIHRAMALVEAIADRNQRLPGGQLPDWVLHMRRVLLEEMDTETIASFRTLGLNFLAPLQRQKGFAPVGANSAYRQLICDIQKEWGLDQAPDLLPNQTRNGS